MATEIKVPPLGESITEATVSRWLKRPGEAVALDEPVAELETDKVTLEVPAPAAGTLAEILAEEGANVPVGAILGTIADRAAVAPHPSPLPASEEREGPAKQEGEGPSALERSGPAVRKLIEETGLDAAKIAPTGPGGRITKADLITARAPAPLAVHEEREVRVRMSRLRRRIAERLKAAQNTAAMLTTFNEIDMSRTMSLREQHRDAFEKKHGVRLGFMSIFVKAAIVALKELPAVNAEIDGDDIVYKNHYDIGVAVGTEQGLVVPVVCDADRDPDVVMVFVDDVVAVDFGVDRRELLQCGDRRFNENRHKAEPHPVLRLERLAVPLAQRDRLAHVDFVERGQHRGGVLCRLQPLGDPASQPAHAHPHFTFACDRRRGWGWCRLRRCTRRDYIRLREPSAGSGRRNPLRVEGCLFDQLADRGPRAFQRPLPLTVPLRGPLPLPTGAGRGAFLLPLSARGVRGYCRPVGDSTEEGADRDVGALRGQDFRERSRGGCGNLERHLVGFELGDRLVHGDRLARLLKPFRNGRFGDRLTEARHLYLGRHRASGRQGIRDELALFLDVAFVKAGGR